MVRFTEYSQRGFKPTSFLLQGNLAWFEQSTNNGVLQGREPLLSWNNVILILVSQNLSSQKKNKCSEGLTEGRYPIV